MREAFIRLLHNINVTTEMDDDEQDVFVDTVSPPTA